MFLIEARRSRRADRPAAIARFILIAGSRIAALSKLRVYYDTNDLDSLTAQPISGVIPIAGALAFDMLRRPPEAEARHPPPEGDESGEADDPWSGDDDEPWLG